MNFNNTVKNLRELAQTSKREGYLGDATEYSFREHTILLLSSLLKEFKGIEKHMKYLWQTLEELEKENENN